MMNIKATKDTYMLKKGIKQEVSGVYIGEMNSIGFKHGRGVLVNTYDKTFYVGYFLNNEKSLINNLEYVVYNEKKQLLRKC